MFATNSIDTTILNDFPVTLEFAVMPAEPEVGLRNDYVEGLVVCHVGTGKRYSANVHRMLNKLGIIDQLEDEAQNSI